MYVVQERRVTRWKHEHVVEEVQRQPTPRPCGGVWSDKVFCISWRNPNAEDRNLTMADYRSCVLRALKPRPTSGAKPMPAGP
jgi:hypothetical protein